MFFSLQSWGWFRLRKLPLADGQRFLLQMCQKLLLLRKPNGHWLRVLLSELLFFQRLLRMRSRMPSFYLEEQCQLNLRLLWSRLLPKVSPSGPAKLHSLWIRNLPLARNLLPARVPTWLLLSARYSHRKHLLWVSFSM
jgi:hypothetical protein